MAFLRGAFLPLFLHIFLLNRSVWGKVELTMNDNLEAYLGDPAEIPCHYSFAGVNEEPSFVIIQWFVRSAGNGSRMRIFYSDVNQQIVDNNTDYTGRIEVTSDQRGNTLLIQNVQLSDEKEFFCQVNGQEAGNAERKTHLRVFAPPEASEIEGVPNGISVTNTMPSKVASCEVRNGFPKPNITWYKDSEPLVPKVGQVNVITLVTREYRGFYSVQSTLEYRILKEDKDSHFSCEVSFSVPGAIRTRMSQSINVTVHYPTTMMELWKDSPQGLVKEGDTVELRCQGDGNPPPVFVFSKEQEPDALLESRGDVLILPSVSRKDSGLYQCRVLESAGQIEVKEEVTLTVHYLDPAVVVPKDLEYMNKGENLVASCNALSSLKTVTIWYKEGKQVGHGNTLHLNDATYETSGQYVCEVTVPSLPSLHTNGSVHIVVQGGPQLAGVEDEIQLEEVAGRSLNLSCEARGHPLPSITWSITGSQNWQEVMSKANDHMTHSMVSVKINSDVSAVCNASNSQGTEVKVFSIKAIPRVTRTAPFSPVEGSGVIIVVIILCLLLLAFLGSVVYFLHKKGKIPCGRSGKQEITKEKPTKDDIVVEMKNNPKNEDAVLLKAVNGEKKGPNDQVTVV